MNSLFSFVTLEQGSPEWLSWRHDGIGGSDASAVMGENRFMSAKSLLESKCRPPSQGRKTAAMARGVALEPKARAWYNDEYSIESEPQCVQSLEFEWLRASLDGITRDGSRAVEIKCGQSAYRTTARTRRPPRYHYGQLQHTMAVTGLPSLDYYCFSPPGRPLMIEIRRDQSYIDRLLREEEKFWNMVLQRREQTC